MWVAQIVTLPKTAGAQVKNAARLRQEKLVSVIATIVKSNYSMGIGVIDLNYAATCFAAIAQMKRRKWRKRFTADMLLLIKNNTHLKG